MNTDDVTRFRSKTRHTETGCLQWTGRLDNGYGRFWLQGKSTLAHRVAWEIARGPVPTDLQIDHLCRNRGYVNVDHLDPVTIAENVLRGVGLSAINAARTRCKHGHPLTDNNVYRRRDGTRNCKRCMRRRTTEWRTRQGAA